MNTKSNQTQLIRPEGWPDSCRRGLYLVTEIYMMYNNSGVGIPPKGDVTTSLQAKSLQTKLHPDVQSACIAA